MALALRFQFLQGTYQAAEPAEIGEPEWPPHPIRVHAALVAAGWARWDDKLVDSPALTALKWLEAAGSPSIALPEEAASRTNPTVYVPRNPTRREVSDALGSLRRADTNAFQRQFGRVDRTFPTMVVGDDPVWFTWPSAEPDGQVFAALDELTGYVSYLGSSRSPVGCLATLDAPAPTLVPSEDSGAYSLRVAIPGFTEKLLGDRHGSGTVVGGSQAYRHARPGVGRGTAEDEPIAGPFRSLVVLRRSRGFKLTLAHSAIVARALRNAVLANAGDAAPSILHGHGHHPHVAFVPLATVGHRYAGGEIRGFALAIPYGTSREDEGQIVAAARQTREIAITQDIVPWRVEHLPQPAEAEEPDPDSTLRTLDPARWIGPSRLWATVTPIVLDRHTRRGRRESVEDVVRLTFTNALLPSPASLDISRFPFIGGAVPVGIHAANGAPRGALLHVKARFERPVRGPVLVGRGRYLGTGVCAPLSDRRAIP